MIPTTHRTAQDMLDSLVTYLKDDKAIQRAVVAEFGWKPSVRQISNTRQLMEARNFRLEKKRSEVGPVESERLFVLNMQIGSKRLRERIILRHPRIIKALEAHGNEVVWNG